MCMFRPNKAEASSWQTLRTTDYLQSVVPPIRGGFPLGCDANSNSEECKGV